MQRTLVLLFVLFGLGVIRTQACTCISEEDVKHARNHADVVFVGKVVKAEKLEVISKEVEVTNFKEPVMRYTLQVERWFKGRIATEEVVVYTGMGGGDCGYDFELNKRSIVYAKRNDVMVERFNADVPLSGRGIYWTNICTRTGIFDEDEAKLLEGKR